MTNGNFKLKSNGAKVSKPDFSLKKKFSPGMINNFIDQSKVDKAESIIEQSKKYFINEILHDVSSLEETFNKLKNDKSIESSSHIEMEVKTLNIKSCSAMYGYPLASEVARSLYSFLTGTSLLYNEKYIKIIELYVKTLKIIYLNNIKKEEDGIGQEVIGELRKLSSISSFRFEEVSF